MDMWIPSRWNLGMKELTYYLTPSLREKPFYSLESLSEERTNRNGSLLGRILLCTSLSTINVSSS
jgi:hypothetical protein